MGRWRKFADAIRREIKIGVASKMGTFEEVRFDSGVKAPPGVDLAGRVFQTKDLQDDPDLSGYEITKQGILCKLYRDSGVSYRYEPVDFTGVVNLVDFFTPGTTEGWVELDAVFENGKMTDLKLVELRHGAREVDTAAPA